MSWIESHDTLARHPKTRRLKRALGVTTPTVIGHLHLLWWWALEFAEDGDLSGYAADELAEAAEWECDPTLFVDSMVSAGFLERPDAGGLLIHDWEEYTGRLVALRQANAQRQRAWRQKHPPAERAVTPKKRDVTPTDPDVTVTEATGDISPNSYVTVMSQLRNGATVPNQTVPNQTIESDLELQEPTPAREATATDDPPPPASRPPTPFSKRESVAPHPAALPLSECPAAAVQGSYATDKGFADEQVTAMWTHYTRHRKGEYKPLAEWQDDWANWVDRQVTMTGVRTPSNGRASPPKSTAPPMRPLTQYLARQES